MKLLNKNKVTALIAVVLVLFVLPLQVSAAATGTHTPVTGVTVGVSGATDNSISGGAVTVTAKGSAGFMGIGASAKTATITVTNDSGSKATVSFDWAATSVNELKIDGTKYTGASGNFSKILNAGSSCTITVTTAKNNTTNTLVMRNFACIAAADNANVTFEFNSTLGSVTLGGTSVSNGSTEEVATSTGAAVVATPASGATFLGWVNAESGAILSENATATLDLASDVTIKAAFAKVGSEAWFLVDSTMLFDDLSIATSKASSVIVLAADGTLPEGDYTIPAGVTLLIPFDDANTLYTTEPGYTSNTSTKPTAYRTLTLGANTSITVNGAISVSGQHSDRMGYTGSPRGKQGFIKMLEGSNITVNSGGSLYAWGYIVGPNYDSTNKTRAESGTVTIKSGGTVYECFQAKDWRGGNATVGMVGNDQGVFPFSQYYVQNVQIPMKLEAGAAESCYMSIYAAKQTKSTAVPFIGESGMFRMTEGYLIKDYDEDIDRQIVDIYGNMQVSNLVVDLGYVLLLGNLKLNSAGYTLPITCNMTVNLKNNSVVSISQDAALLPGAEMIVDANAKLVITQNTELYIYDIDNWGGYTYSNNSKFMALDYAYDKTYTRTEADLVDAKIMVYGELDASAGYIYTTAAGANICGSKESAGKVTITPGTATETYQATQGGSEGNEITAWPSIPITPAKLKNADGTYLQSATNTYAYDSTNGKWVCAADENGNDTHTDSDPQDGTCDVCGTVLCAHANTEEIPAVSATCTGTGLTAGTKCSDCGAILVAQEIVPALGHTEETVAGKDATCTETGLTDGVKCSVCGETLIAQEEIPALGHTEETIPGKDATCTETGLTDGAKCSVCGVTLNAQEEIPATGHTEETIPGKAATCIETGLTDGVKCSICDETLTAQKELPVDSDNHVDLEQVDKLDPTCEHPGHEAYEYCTSCDYSSSYVEIPMLAHIDMDGDKDHLCDNNCGTKVSACGITYVDYQGGSIEVHNEDIAALKASTFIQDMGVGTLLEKVEYCAAGAADMSEGLLNTLFANVQFREYLAGELNTNTDSLDSYLSELSGEEGNINKIQANAVVLYVAKLASGMETENIINFLTKGDAAYEFIYNGVTTDNQCGEAVTYAALTYGMYNAYAYGDFGGNMEIASDAVQSITQLKDDPAFLDYLNSEDGKRDLKGFLAGLNTINNRLRIAHLDAVGDAYLGSAFLQEKNELVEHLLTNGYTGEELTALLQEQLDGYSHQCAECGKTLTDCIWTDSSCIEAKKCILCGKTDGETPGHSYEAVTTAPTCTEVGYTTYTCSACGDSYVDDEVAALGHSYAEPEKSAWNWTDSGEAGYSATVTLTCEKCQVTESVEANVTSEEADGKVIYTATVTSGVKTYTDTKTVDIAEHEHSYDEGTVTKEATCVEDGVMTFTCGCGDSYTESIPATGHTEAEAVKENEVAATCTTAGSYDSVVYCSVCKTHVISRTTVPVDALGHNYVDGFCGVCGEAEESGCEIGNHTFTNEADSTCNLCGEEREDVIPVKADGLVFYNNNLSFQEYIGIQPMLRKSVMSPYAYVYAKVVQTSVDGTNEPVSIEPTLVPGTTSWYIINVKVMSCDMTDNFSITLYGVTADGIVHEGATISTSVEDLALEKLQSYSAEGNELFCTILADMLNYGAAVQTAFNYHVSSLPNTQLGEYSRYATLTTPELINNATVEGSKADSISYDGGIFLSFQAQVEFQMLIKSTDSIENYELRVTDENGVTVCYGADCFTPNGSYYVPRVAIKAADLRNQYTLAIYNVNTNTAASKVYTSSIADQAASRLADEKLGPAVIAMMKYGDAVRAYVDASKS